MDPRRDIAILLTMRGLRLSAYGGLAVVIALYLVEIGLSPGEVGLLLALTLAGDTLVSLLLTTHADRIGRGRTLVIGAALMTLGGLVFAVTGSSPCCWLPRSSRCSARRATRSARSSPSSRRRSARWSPGSSAPTHPRGTSSSGRWLRPRGALAAGVVVQAQLTGAGEAEAYRSVIVGYALIGIAIGLLAMLLTRAVEPDAPPRRRVRAAAPRAPPVATRRRRARRCSRSTRSAGSSSRVSWPCGSGCVGRWNWRCSGRSSRGERARRAGAASARRAACGTVRAHRDDGRDAPSIERDADPGALHADAPAGDRAACCPVRDQPDGRPDPPVIHDGRRRTG